jgi:anti-anti-sigma factor
MSTIMHIDEQFLEGTAVAVLDGELDTANVGEVGARLRRLVENRAMRLVVDLSRVSYLDSAGINLLFAVGGELRARQQELHLVVRPGSPIERMLRIAGASEAFPTHAQREDALAAPG